MPNLATSIGEWPASVPAQRAPDTHTTWGLFGPRVTPDKEEENLLPPPEIELWFLTQPARNPCHNANYAIPSPDEISRITKSLEYLISGNYHHQSTYIKK